MQPNDNQLSSMRLSVIEPLLFAIIFFVLELIKILISQENLTTAGDCFWNIGNLLVSCFSATLIPTATIMIIQQYFLGITVGLNKRKSIILFLCLVIYLLVFGINFRNHLMWLERVRLGDNKINVGDVLLTAFSVLLTVFFAFWLWFSLEDDVRKITKAASSCFNGTNDSHT